MKFSTIKLTFIAFLALVFLNGCGTDENTGANNITPLGNDELVSAEIIDDINASTMLSIVKVKIDANATNAFAYKAVKIKYKTTNENGTEVNASGLLVIPTATEAYNAYRASQGDTPFSVSIMIDHHGTIFTHAEAPTVVEQTNGLPDTSLAVLATGYAGFAYIAPDYIGYGDSNDTVHPYLLKQASANDSMAMLNASIKYMADNNIPFNYQVYIGGYSQGGHSALALAEEIQMNHLDKFSLKAIAPMAAPSIISSFGDTILKSDGRMSVPAFMAYIAQSYTTYYDDLNLSEMIQADRLASFDNLFDGQKDKDAIHTQLGYLLASNAPTNSLFDDDFISDYESSNTHKLKTRFAQNNVANFATDIPINLIHCQNDDVIPYEMSAGAKQLLELAGSTNVTLTPITNVTADYMAGESIHGNCGITAYQTAIGYFATIRGGN
jgi:pimeloyl-ACP methyl ester carboxylesterase